MLRLKNVSSRLLLILLLKLLVDRLLNYDARRVLNVLNKLLVRAVVGRGYIFYVVELLILRRLKYHLRLLLLLRCYELDLLLWLLWLLGLF